jgi:hypothetical protein
MDEGLLYFGMIESTKTRAIDIHEVLRVPLFYICCTFWFYDVSLLASGFIVHGCNDF